MVLHGDLGSVTDLAETHFKKLAERRGGHGAGRADLRLAAALRAGDGGVRLDEIADHAARSQRADDCLIGEAALLLHIKERRGHNAARAARRRRDDLPAGGVLLGYGERIRAHEPVFARLRAFVDVAAVVEILRLTLDLQSARQLAGAGETVGHALLHCVPDIIKIVPDLLSFPQKHIIAQPQPVCAAKGGDLRVARFRIDLRRLGVGPAGDGDRAAADGEGRHLAGERAVFVRAQLHRVRVRQVGALRVPEDVGVHRRKRVAHGDVGQMAAPGQGERAEERDLIAVGVRVFLAEETAGARGADGVGAGRASPDGVKLAQRFHAAFFLSK